MRTTIVAVAVLMCASALFAQDAGKTQLSVTTSNLGFGESNGRSQWSGGVAVALSRAWSPQWSTELSVAAERHTGLFTRFEVQPLQPIGSIVPVTEKRSFHVFPVDLTTQYRFTNSTRWTPYVSGGLRFVAAPAGQRSTASIITPSGTAIPVNGGFNFEGDRASAEIGVGTSLRLTPHFGLRFDATRLLRSNDVNYDPLLRASAGINWRF